MKIYIVFGATGEYSDRNEWAVCAYSNEDEAKAKVERCEKIAKELEASPDEDGLALRHIIRPETHPQFYVEDIDITMDYTGTYYYICETELL